MSTTTVKEDPHLEPVSDEHAAILKAYQKPSYRYLVLGILTTVYVSNFVDRQVINVLAQPIIDDLNISDGQFGMLSGLAFAFIYTTLGVPIARWADISNRRNIVAASVAIWSVMTALCGAAQSFAQLFLARFGVGVGEAGGSPPSHSIVSDIFPAEQRATALSIYSLGVYGGILVGTVGGAYLVQYFDWRTAFIVVGMPGILLALVVRFVVKEPPRGMAEARKDVAPPGFFSVMGFLWERRSFRHLSFACALHAFVTYGMGNFMPLFLGRVHDMPILGCRLVLRHDRRRRWPGRHLLRWVGNRPDEKADRRQHLVHLGALHLYSRCRSTCTEHLPPHAGWLYCSLFLSSAGLCRRLVSCALHCCHTFSGRYSHARDGISHTAVYAESDRARAGPDDDGIHERLANAPVW